MLAVNSLGCGDDLVLLHGWAANLAIWQPLLAYLTPKYRVHLIDLPGHGLSPLIASGAEAWVDVLAHQLPKQCHIVGWSLGGTLALLLKQRLPEQIEKILMIAANPKFAAEPDWPGVTGQHFKQLTSALAIAPQKTIDRFLTLQCRDNRQRPLRQLKQSIQNRGKTQIEALFQGLEILRGQDLRDLVRTYGKDLCWLLGERDPLIPVTIEYKLKDLNPACKIVTLAQAGHAPLVSSPNLVSQHIYGYLDR